MSIIQCSLLSLGCAFGFSPPTDQSILTAFRALKIAQRRLRPEVRTKLLSLSSPRTGSALTPEAWRFVFLDAATSGHARVVTVAAKTSSEHPETVEAFSGHRHESDPTTLEPLAQNRLLIDSDATLDRMRQASLLKGLKAAQYRLCQMPGASEPKWTVDLFAEADAPVATFFLGAKSGTSEVVCHERSPGN